MQTGFELALREPVVRGPVLACVDDRPGTQAAVDVAGRLAEAMGSRLILTAVQPAAPGGADPAYLQELTRMGHALLARAARGRLRGAELRVEFGEPAERLIAVAQREGCEVVVMGGRGLSPVGAPRLGNAHLALAGAGPCPVVIVPQDPPAGDGPILCGLDGSSSSDHALRAALALAAPMGAPVRAVQVREEPARRLAELAVQDRARLVVVGSRGWGADASALLGRVGARLAATASCPVMIVPPAPPPADAVPAAAHALTAAG